ncbi:competence type IV pilus ATPase ComGA [Bacillus sp. FSL W7-1360]
MEMDDVFSASQALIKEAINRQASDIHFTPQEDGYRIAYRIHGQMNDETLLPWMEAARLLSHFKYTAGMDIGERRKPQSTSMTFTHEQQTYHLRLSTLPAKKAESLAIRLTPRFASYTLDQLPVLKSHSKRLKSFLTYESGLLLFTGATGSGKTTTLYACIKALLAQKQRAIVSIEDPVEHEIDGIVQVETNERAGITFSSALKAVLRHDPDIIVIGEIRDQTTAQLAFRAALTGHLVLATLHTGSARMARHRLEQFEIAQCDWMEAIRAIIHQKLVPLKDGDRRMALYEWLTCIEEDISQATNTTVTIPHAARRAWSIGTIDDATLQSLCGKKEGGR